MTAEESPIERPLTASHWICSDCVGDQELTRRIYTGGTPGWCNVCGRNGPRATLEELAEWIDPVYRNLYEPGSYVPRFRDAESDRPDYEQEGDAPSWILQGLAGIDYEVAEALVSILSAGDWTAIREGEEPFYDEGSCYVRVDPHVDPYYDLWIEFEQRIRHSRRFHDQEATTLLAEMFADLELLATDSGQPHIRILSPGDSAPRLYRARRARNADEADIFGRDPATHLAPPPADRRSGGRLNAPGIAVFYGAFDPETCIAEIRPAVGSWLVVAGFEPTRPLRLLDLTAFSDAPPEGSPFASGYIDMVERWRFLRTFHSIVSTPVLPQEEALRYVTTQVVAEYMANILNFDGLIYASAQMGGVAIPEDDDDTWDGPPPEKCNVALFNANDCIATPSTDGEIIADPNPTPSLPWAREVFALRNSSPGRCAISLRYTEGTALVHFVTAVRYTTCEQPPRPASLPREPTEPDF